MRRNGARISRRAREARAAGLLTSSQVARTLGFRTVAELDDGRVFQQIPFAAFAAGPGQRFWLYDEWQAEREVALKQFAELLEKEYGIAKEG